ncbi:unnamed protein product [Closterium sp. NIES-53]
MGGAEPGGAESGGAEPGGAESEGAESRGAEPGGAGSGGAEPEGAEPGGAGSTRVASRGTSSRRELLSPQELREWFARRWSRAAGAGGTTVAARVGPAGGTAGATGGIGAAGPSGTGAAGATGAGAAGGVGAGVSAGAGTSEGAGVGAVGALGAAGAGAAAEGTGVVPAGSGGATQPRPYSVPLREQVLGLPPSAGPAPPLASPEPVPSQSQLQPASPLPTPSPYTGPTGGLTKRREPMSRPASPVRAARTSRRAPRPRPPVVPGTHQMALRPSTAPLRVPLPSPPESSLPVLLDPVSDSIRAASPTVARLLATVVTDPSFESTAASALVAELVDFAAHYRLDYATSLVAESAFVYPPSVGGECALSTDVLEDRQEEFQCFAAALPPHVSTLTAPEGDPDAPDIPTPQSYAEAIEGPYSSQWQSAMDAEMASWKSTGTYVDEVPPPGANIVSGMWIFRVKRPPGSPPVFKARYVARGFSQRQGVDYFQTFSPTRKMTTLRVLLHVAAQRDYELHSLDFSTAFLQGSLHEEIWLRRPPGFTGITLAALGFAPSTADPSLFLRIDTSLPPFYILVYVDDLVFAIADTAGLAHVKSKLQKRHTCTDLGELRSYLGLQITRDRAQRTITLTQSHMVQQVLQRFDFTYSSPQATPLSTRHSLLSLPSDESVEPSGPYPELVGCLMYLMTCTRPDLAYPLSILARYVAPGRHRPEQMAAAKRVLRYLCSTSGLGLVLGGRSPVVLTGHADASWVDDLATQRSSQGYTFSLGSGSVSWRSTRSSSVLSSSYEAEIYAGAMAAQELRWLTYLLTDLGEPPRSPPVLYNVLTVTFDKSVPFYRLFPYRFTPPPPPPLFLAPGPPLVALVSGAGPSAASGGATSRGAASGGAEPGGAWSEGAGSGGAEPEGVEPGGAESEGAESGGAERRSAALSGGPADASSQELRKWLVRRSHRRSGAREVGGAGDTEAGGAAIPTGAIETGGVGCARAGDPTEPGAAGAVGVGVGVAGVGGLGAGGAEAAGAGVGGTGAGGAGAVGARAIGPGAGAFPLPAPSSYTEQSGGLTERCEPASHPVSPVRTARRAPHLRPPPVPGTHTMALRPSSILLRFPLLAPPESSLPEVSDLESDRARAASPTVACLLATAVTDPYVESAAASTLVAELLDIAVACRLDYATALVAESVFATPPFVGGECALGTDVLEDRKEDFECLARFASMLLACEGDPDAPDIPTPHSYAEAITGPHSSQWQAAMDAEMGSWKSTGSYVDEVPPPWANIVDGMWIFRVKRPPSSPHAFKARYVGRGFSLRQGVDYFHTFSPTLKMTTLQVLLHVAAQRDYELHSQDFCTAFLQGSLHEEIWLCRPPGFIGTFLAGTQWSLRRPVYGLRQAPREWHDTMRTTLAALGFAPSTADPSLFLRTDTSLLPFYVLVYVDGLVFATADTEALTLVKSELQKRRTCTDLGKLRSFLGLHITWDRARRTVTLSKSHMVHQVLQRFGFQYSLQQLTSLCTSHSLSALPSDEAVEPSGPYLELVGCLMYLMTCTRPDLAYPLSLMAHYVAPGRHRKVHWDAAKGVLRYLCSTSGMGLVLGGRGPVVLTGSSCEAEIYAGAMAAQELRWLTYLLTDLREQPRSPQVMYVDNKAMIALCQEHRPEHRTKHNALQYFLARELQQRGQLHLAYVATRAIIANVFTKALPPSDHQRFATVLGLVPTLPHLLTA